MRTTIIAKVQSAREASIIIDWCNETLGFENWELETIENHRQQFMFYREEDATMFRLKWSCIE